MNSGEIYSNDLLEIRFRKLLLTLRLAGIPVNIQSVSRVRSAYNVIIVVSFYITFCSALMDFLVSADNLKELMKSTRVLLGMGVVLWQHFFLR
jgi:hypothetical protein